MAFIIGIEVHGSVKSTRFFIFYIHTCRSFFLLVALGLIYTHVKIWIFFTLKLQNFFFKTTVYLMVFFYRFAIKIPMVPFHVWCQKHTLKRQLQAQYVSCCVVKIGSYGMLKYLFPLFPEITIYNTHLYQFLFSQGCFMFFNSYSSNDIKKVIAYSSVAHMSMWQPGFFSYLQYLCRQCFFNVRAWLVSAGLFFCIGFLYERLKHVILSIMVV